ncbi:efflux transporter outer membrane subunit [Zestomonas carbonaria]|uniref:Cation efflux system protein CusC n=1 Tax=Zestomonas carbonaria TaxID=2762745 RepID=A0A7U7ENX2_9GAMM|nr:efflux transporter outer membrane subunit [Pseudomonas carbonaria]CAD5108467.1 Cation efflux system protein CusC [Pseudomonas carbonaria]
MMMFLRQGLPGYRVRTFALFASALLLGACALDRPTVDPDVTPPPEWRYTPAADPRQAEVDARWWRRFGSEELDALVARAEEGSLDLQAAVARVGQAQALARVAGAALVPELEVGLDASRERRLSGDVEVEGDFFTLGFRTRYELDFWGRNRALRDAAQAEFRASRFDLATVCLTLTAGVASSWLQVVGLRERLSIAVLNLENAEQVLATVESRHRAGAAVPLELAQQQGLVAEQRREVEALRSEVGDSEVALATLLGIPVQRLSAQAGSLAGVDWPAIDAGLPAELLMRRPDLARAEARLEAANANIVAARAALLPSIRLDAGLGFAGERGSQLLDSTLYNLTGAVLAPIFNGGRLRAQRDLAEAQQLELLADYRRGIVAAFADVEISLNGIRGLDAQMAAQDERLRRAREAFELAEARYRAGAETLLILLDAQRTLYAAQDQQVRLRQARLQASVALYKALGGGWSPSWSVRDGHVAEQVVAEFAEAAGDLGVRRESVGQVAQQP